MMRCAIAVSGATLGGGKRPIALVFPPPTAHSIAQPTALKQRERLTENWRLKSTAIEQSQDGDPEKFWEVSYKWLKVIVAI